MLVQLHTGVRHFLSLWLFVSLIALIVVIMLLVRAISRPGRWHERTREAGLVQSMECKEMIAST